MPAWADEAFAKAGPEGERALAVDMAVDLCRRLIEGGVDRLHFYTVNRPQMTLAVCEGLGIAPQQAKVA